MKVEIKFGTYWNGSKRHRKIMFPLPGESGNLKVSSICPVNCHASMLKNNNWKI